MHELIIATGYKSEKFIEYIEENFPQSNLKEKESLAWNYKFFGLIT